MKRIQIVLSADSPALTHAHTCARVGTDGHEAGGSAGSEGGQSASGCNIKCLARALKVVLADASRRSEDGTTDTAASPESLEWRLQLVAEDGVCGQTAWIAGAHLRFQTVLDALELVKQPAGKKDGFDASPYDDTAAEPGLLVWVAAEALAHWASFESNKCSPSSITVLDLGGACTVHASICAYVPTPPAQVRLEILLRPRISVAALMLRAVVEHVRSGAAARRLTNARAARRSQLTRGGDDAEQASEHGSERHGDGSLLGSEACFFDSEHGSDSSALRASTGLAEIAHGGTTTSNATTTIPDGLRGVSRRHARMVSRMLDAHVSEPAVPAAVPKPQAAVSGTASAVVQALAGSSRLSAPCSPRAHTVHSAAGPEVSSPPVDRRPGFFSPETALVKQLRRPSRQDGHNFQTHATAHATEDAHGGVGFPQALRFAMPSPDLQQSSSAANPVVALHSVTAAGAYPVASAVTKDREGEPAPLPGLATVSECMFDASTGNLSAGAQTTYGLCANGLLRFSHAQSAYDDAIHALLVADEVVRAWFVRNITERLSTAICTDARECEAWHAFLRSVSWLAGLHAKPALHTHNVVFMSPRKQKRIAASSMHNIMLSQARVRRRDAVGSPERTHDSLAAEPAEPASVVSSWRKWCDDRHVPARAARIFSRLRGAYWALVDPEHSLKAETASHLVAAVSTALPGAQSAAEAPAPQSASSKPWQNTEQFDPLRIITREIPAAIAMLAAMALPPPTESASNVFASPAKPPVPTASRACFPPCPVPSGAAACDEPAEAVHDSILCSPARVRRSTPSAAAFTSPTRSPGAPLEPPVRALTLFASPARTPSRRHQHIQRACAAQSAAVTAHEAAAESEAAKEFSARVRRLDVSAVPQWALPRSGGSATAHVGAALPDGVTADASQCIGLAAAFALVLDFVRDNLILPLSAIDDAPPWSHGAAATTLSLHSRARARTLQTLLRLWGIATVGTLESQAQAQEEVLALVAHTSAMLAEASAQHGFHFMSNCKRDNGPVPVWIRHICLEPFIGRIDPLIAAIYDAVELPIPVELGTQRLPTVPALTTGKRPRDKSSMAKAQEPRKHPRRILPDAPPPMVVRSSRIPTLQLTGHPGHLAPALADTMLETSMFPGRTVMPMDALTAGPVSFAHLGELLASTSDAATLPTMRMGVSSVGGHKSEGPGTVATSVCSVLPTEPLKADRRAALPADSASMPLMRGNSARILAAVASTETARPSDVALRAATLLGRPQPLGDLNDASNASVNSTHSKMYGPIDFKAIAHRADHAAKVLAATGPGSRPTSTRVDPRELTSILLADPKLRAQRQGRPEFGASATFLTHNTHVSVPKGFRKRK